MEVLDAQRYFGMNVSTREPEGVKKPSKSVNSNRQKKAQEEKKSSLLIEIEVEREFEQDDLESNQYSEDSNLQSQNQIIEISTKHYKQWDKKDLEKRENAINEFFEFICPLCDTDLKTYKGFYFHMKEKHKIKHPMITCCNIQIQVTPKQLYSHIQYHINPSDLSCYYCGKEFQTHKKKASHEKRHISIQNGAPLSNHSKRKCEVCGLVLAHTWSYQNHIKKHLSPELREKDKVECDECGKRFHGKATLLTHIQDKHNDEIKQFICDLCAECFTTHTAFSFHYKYHHTEYSRKVVPCPDCGVQIKLEGLRQHRELKHVLIPQTCELCGKEFRNRFTLKLVLSLIIYKKKL